ncbi:glycosyltransferase [Arthrobacter koreensis]|uniref:glycosyltransferase n=1 Tax=Arthrobacter koreensis TaxID=199136 RepID=UPI002DBA864F|nr:glycosyltransferase [Arthrobacter koreensis]MEB7505060.1 glycosyltransferase [Arthrobacter koreensis]
MRASYTGFVDRGQSPVAELWSALTSLSSVGRPHLYGYTPVARNNPFQSLLYKKFADHGIATAPILRPEKFRALTDFRDLANGTTLHLHWNAWMTFGSVEPDRARRMAMGIIGRLESLRAKGSNLVWTVHNLYPHDAKFIDLELEVQQRIADSANVIHVMSRSTQDAMKGIVDLAPEKVLFAPHPNYRGAYQDLTTREEARCVLGLGPDEVVFLLFGALKPYKGLQRLLDALDIVVRRNPDRQIRLLVAGAPDDSPEAESFVRNALVHPNVLIEPARIPAERAQYFLRASDVGLVNYERMLNSGAALLYQTFGLPTVAADQATLREGLPSDATVFVDGTGPDDFADALEKATETLVSKEIRDRVAAYIRQFDPDIVSDRFASDLLERLQ